MSASLFPSFPVHPSLLTRFANLQSAPCTVQPKVINRFPIRILGSTTRPTASAALQDTFDLSVQGCTEISSLLVLLYTRIKLSHEDSNFGSAELHLNAIRLWHLDEDRLVRLSNGTIASNEITPKSILCYTIGKRTGKSFVHTYVDESKVSRVEVDIELSRPWQSKEQDEGLEEVSRIVTFPSSSITVCLLW